MAELLSIPAKPNSRNHMRSTQQTIVLEPSRVDVLRKVLNHQVSPELAIIIAKKSGKSTLDRYQAHWKRFTVFAGQRTISPSVVLDYLLSLFNQGLAVRTLMVHKSALTDPLFYGFKINVNDKIFLDFLKSLRTMLPIKNWGNGGSKT